MVDVMLIIQKLNQQLKKRSAKENTVIAILSHPKARSPNNENGVNCFLVLDYERKFSYGKWNRFSKHSIKSSVTAVSQ